ncbi:MAG: hypothetical protein ACOCTJ_03000, partial [Desulfobia sp.]
EIYTILFVGSVRWCIRDRARALGRVGENKSLVLIEKALSKERFQWVRTIMEESMARIEKT